MTNVTITVKKKLALGFEVTDEEMEELKDGFMPDRIEDELNKTEHWMYGSVSNYSVWDCNKAREIITDEPY